MEIEDAQAMLNQDPNGSSITRTESGDLIGVTTQYFNEDQTDLKGIDLSINSIFNFKNFGPLLKLIKVSRVLVWFKRTILILFGAGKYAMP